MTVDWILILRMHMHRVQRLTWFIQIKGGTFTLYPTLDCTKHLPSRPHPLLGASIFHQLYMSAASSLLLDIPEDRAPDIYDSITEIFQHPSTREKIRDEVRELRNILCSNIHMFRVIDAELTEHDNKLLGRFSNTSKTSSARWKKLHRVTHCVSYIINVN